MLQSRHMKVFFDARYIRTDFHDGISRYSTELGAALAKMTPVTFLICDPAQQQFLPKHAHFLQIHQPASLKEPFTARILNKYQPDIVFSPLQTMGSAGRKFKLILTLHDMIYYRHRTPPRQLSPLLKLGWRAFHLSLTPQRMALNGADIVATVSHTVKREFQQHRLTKRPIIVIPNAPQRFNTHKVTQQPTVKNIVYMGSFMPYKNVETLIAAMEWLPGKTLHLLSKIDPTRRTQLTALIPNGADVRFYGGVTDDEYEAVLANNAVLATASHDEGYGLPVAEALAMGVPAVVSNIPIFHEVAAGGAIYADPDSPKAFADAVLSLDDPAKKAAVIAAGKKHSATFTWKQSAQALYDAMKSLV